LNLEKIKDDTQKKKLLKSTKEFILRGCWKMIDVLPFDNDLLKDLRCFYPHFFNFQKILNIGKRFEKFLLFPLYSLSQELSKFEKNLEAMKELFSKVEKDNDEKVDSQETSKSKKKIDQKKSKSDVIIQFYMEKDIMREYSGLSYLAGMMVALPHTSVEIERLFSQLKLIKTDRRTCIKEENLESLILFKLSNISFEEPVNYEQFKTNKKKMNDQMTQKVQEHRKRKQEDLEEANRDNEDRPTDCDRETFEDLLTERMKKLKLLDSQSTQDQSQMISKEEIFEEFYL
jgi:hypothetical protein